MRIVLLALVWIGALVLAVATLLPMTGLVTWWAIAPEFPRLHILAAAALLALLAAGLRAWLALVILLGVIGWQGWRIAPFTPLWEPELFLTLEEEAGGPITLVSLNLQMENEEKARIVDYLAQASPDILLLMENDADWMEALAPVLEGYETVIAEPRDNHYGMALATRLPARNARVEYFEEGTPTTIADLTSPDGFGFTLVGLHPRPPIPGREMADHRDQLLRAGEIAEESGLPVLAMGDFNAPSWSGASRDFKRMGGYLDARIGRAILHTFDTESWWMRFPIDQLYVTPGIDMLAFGRGPDVGSDHWPLEARVAIWPRN